MTRDDLLKLLHAHRALDAHEAAMLAETIRFVAAEPRCAERTLASGHLTGSAWIVDAARTRTLLTHHRKLEKWLQLGGHADGDLDIAAVALREAREESGLRSVRPVGERIFDVDRHWIPARRDEPAHWHYDLRFLFEADTEEPLVITPESKDLAWVELARLTDYTTEESMLRMARRMTSGRRHLVVFGAGYVGGALARRALAAGWRVTALTRNPETAAGLRAAGCAVVVGELAGDAWWSDPALAGGADRVAVTVAAGGGGVDGYRRSYVEGLRSVVGWGRRVDAGSGRLGRLIYTSSTSVYSQDDGVRVTEADRVGGEAETTRALVEAERIAGEWQGAGVTVLRLAGIYGPERTHLLEQVRSGEVAGRPEAHLNLIYRDDVLDAMEAVWSKERGAGSRELECGSQSSELESGGTRAEVFNIADSGEATKGEVAAWLAERLGVAMPRFTGQPAGGRRAVTPDRIIDSARARAVLGWTARHRTFREGYSEVLAAGR